MNVADERIQSLSDIVGAIRQASCDKAVSVRDVMEEIGTRSFGPAILVPSLLLVSPISGIPGFPTIGAIFVVIIVAQALLGRDHLWLPDFLLRRCLPSDRMHQALDWLEKPAAFVDARSQSRLKFLTDGPARTLCLIVILLIALAWPPLELLPMVTSVGALAVALFALGLLARDGAFVLAGYCVVALAVFGVLQLTS
ncbi:Uncharacterized conserved protein [Poseidonocella pacifica]|uniref:Uncharacterized conserved protein n=1 Tax=Poseidonocella pacifica TaxID=871651 RepID=A0A1I0XNT2_9RHOB|nr:exopolysaccharide biosynthesis protein [Poseidonocella pacifica]SFB01950.1 Uncharacterized conserved protein [Poseidonocella pacifica]